jgi:hypothetical protein
MIDDRILREGRRHARPRVESLEGRELLSIGPAAISPGPAAVQASAVRAVIISPFNGRNLNGFRVGDVRLDGLTTSPDGRFQARRGVLIINPGQGIQELTTRREFNRDFTLRLEFRASPSSDSGVFIRGVQLQVRDYPRVGPYTDLTGFRDGGWNRLEIVVRSDGAGGAVATCTCNGEVLETALRVPATGPIAFQAETGLFEYRRITIRPIR